MDIVNSRDFRAQMSLYMKKAKSTEVIIKSRDFGSFRLVPIKETDKVISEDEMVERITEAMKAYQNGECKTYTAKELRKLAGL